ncbi:DsbA family oxidoreductase [Halomonas smyrnensis]|uniref:DsbA family oxidoreductase n=1 Tax=Halomonas smyrnensis TaxID=720605 RepID=UPI000369435E|nr:DsbA family oxidoreductase [Halomonas smyrnensis]
MTRPVRVDIVSDVVCPFCVIGYHQLACASTQAGIPIEVYWHPFELNPQMESGGENLIQHMVENYGVSAEETRHLRKNLTEMGNDLGFSFNFTDELRLMNTFQAHQMIEWASEQGFGLEMTLEIFKSYFTFAENLDEREVLVAAASRAGLNPESASDVLQSGSHAEIVKEHEAFGKSLGISGVPTMLFEHEHLISGVQGVEAYARTLNRMIECRVA